MTDLWPDDLLEPENLIDAPVNIVRTQGKILGDKTGNVINGQAHRISKSRTGREFGFVFQLVAPTISYSFSLFTFEYNIDLYPTLLFPDEKLHEELRALNKFETTSSFISVENEDILIILLTDIFKSDRVYSVIRGIIAQLKK